MRGKIEGIQLYCKDAGVDLITLRYSPMPGFGPVGEVTITPLATWSWVTGFIEEMWNYDSLFIWVYACEAGTDWGYEIARPFDGHSSSDAGATWSDRLWRPFMRVLYTAQTVGDIPVSGIINNIPIPGTTSYGASDAEAILDDVETVVYELDGIGYCNYVFFGVLAAAFSEFTQLVIYADGVLAARLEFQGLFNMGCGESTPGTSLARFGADNLCSMIVTKRIDFRRKYEIRALNIFGNQTINYIVLPTLLR